jgi:hypothetical protein
MSNQTTYKLLRKTLLGIRISPFDQPPILKINNWKVYDAGKVDSLPPEERKLNFNYQIERGDSEKILIRIYLDSEGRKINKIKYYYITCDSELAYYLMMEFIKRLQPKYSLSKNHKVFEFPF